MKIVVIIPTYNESKNISRMINELVVGEFSKIKNADMHLLVVDDNSPDGTGQIVMEAMKKHKNIHILQGNKQGLGMAYTRGMKHAMKDLKADATIEMDADFQHDPKYVKDLVNAFVEEGADYVIGSRYIKGGSIPKGWAPHRKAVSFFGNLFARIVLFLPNLHDTTTGFRLTRVKGVLDKIDLDHLMELHRFAFKVDLFFKTVKLSKKVIEVPIHFAERTQENSKFSLMEMVATYKVVMLLRIKDSQRFLKFATVGFLGYLINASGLELFYRLGLSTGVSAALGAELAIIMNFLLNNFWTFSGQTITDGSKLLKKFAQFNFTSLGAILIQAVVVGLGTSILGDQWRQVMLFIAVGFFVLPYNYAAYNILIWKTWNVPGLRWLQKLVG